MRKLTGITAAFAVTVTIMLLSACHGNESDSVPVSFNDGWLFIRQDSASAEKVLPGIIPNHRWEEVSLPHTAFMESPDNDAAQWTGICWYRKLYRPEKRQRHRHTGLLFDGAMNDAIVYLNGAEIARHTGGFLPFYVNLTDDLEYGRENELLVRLDNRESPYGPYGQQAAEHGFRWYSGLYRSVSLYVTDRLHITTSAQSNAPLGGGIITGVRDVSRESATLTLSVHITNDDRTPGSFRMKNSLLDAAGLEVASSLSELNELEPGQSIRLMTRMIVMQPALWTPETPFLYTVRTELLTDNGAVIDRRETRTGIRTVRVSPDKRLLLNGQPVTLEVTDRRQEYPYIGYALSDDASYRDAFKIREAGFNAVRSLYCPPSPAFLDACDELGLMVIDAVPGWHYGHDSLSAGAAVHEVQMLCRRDRNHPSVVIWETSLMEAEIPAGLLSILHQAVKDELPFGNNITSCRSETICDLCVPDAEPTGIMNIFRLPAVPTQTESTPGRPVAIRLTADFSNKPLRADGADVIFVYAALTDSTGNTSVTADSLVEFTVRGNAELLGSNPVRAVNGIATILLRAHSQGRTMIKASSEGMSEAELMTETRETGISGKSGRHVQNLK
jgi:beta-galactosidase